jgi:hypothetical protein
MAFDRHTAIAAVVTSGVSHRFLRIAGIMRTTQTRLGTATSRQRVTGFEGCPDFENDTKFVGDVGGHDDSDS